MDIIKKAFGFLCMGCCAFLLGSSVKAAVANGEIEFSPSNIIFDENGNTSVKVNFNRVNEFYYGDVDGDGDIDLTDAQFVLKISLGQDISSVLPSDYKKRADVDGDGKITKNDAEMIVKKYLKIPVNFETKNSTNANSEISEIKYAWIDINSDKELANMFSKYFALQKEYVDAFAEAVDLYNQQAEIEQNGDTMSDEYREISGRSSSANSKANRLENELNTMKESISMYIKNNVQLTTTTDNTITGNVGNEEVTTRFLYVEVITNSGESYTALNVADTSDFKWITTTTETKENPDTSVVGYSLISIISIILINILITRKRNIFNTI